MKPKIFCPPERGARSGDILSKEQRQKALGTVCCQDRVRYTGASIFAFPLFQ
jgi:hypothetical protein